ncbi:MAG TPA: protease modulator HflK, partial [Methyloceanibacter sp.]|nr:protease modulator HflK [Methyloceanibacter sp.]
MPWSNQSGGGGWKGGPGGPWGPRPGGPNQQPDLEEILRRGQDRIRQAIPSGRMGGPFAVMIAVALVALIGFFGFTVRVNPEELGVVLRFGKFVRLLPPGLNFRWPYPIEVVELPKVTRVNRIELGMRGSAENRETSTAVRDVPEESLMLTGDENIVDVDFVVFWRISDAPKFLFNIQDPEMTVKDVAESAMREIVGQSVIEPLLTEARAKTEAAVQSLMQKTLDSYGAGVQVTQVQL